MRYRFNKHGDVIEGRNSVGDGVFHALQRVLGLRRTPHEVRVHAAGDGRVDQRRPRHHRLNREGYPGQIQIATDDLFTHDLYHLLSDRTDLVDLRLITADLAALGVRQIVSMLLIVGEKSTNSIDT